MLKEIAIIGALLVSVSAGDKPAVPTAVRTVISGGYWEQKDQSGIYRVVVVEEGFQHIWFRCFVEWVAHSNNPNEDDKVVASKELKSPFAEGEEVTDFDVRLKSSDSGRADILVSGVRGFKPYKKVKAIFIATLPGEIKSK